MRLKKYFTLVIVAILMACSSNDDGGIDGFQADGTKLTARIDGRNFAAQDAATAAGFSQSDGIVVILVSGGSASVSSNTVTSEAIAILLTVFQEPAFEASSQWYENTMDGNVIVAGAYTLTTDINDDEGEIDASTDFDGSNARVRITKLDRSTGLMSGEFEFIAWDSDIDEFYTITQGRFNDVQFEVD